MFRASAAMLIGGCIALAGCSTTSAHKTPSPVKTTASEPVERLPEVTRSAQNARSKSAFRSSGAIAPRPATRLKSAVDPKNLQARYRTADAATPNGVLMAATASPRDNLRVHFIPVGAGSCHVIECPGGDDVVINDCGQVGSSVGNWDLESEIAPYIASIVGGDKPMVVISHPDRDHYWYIPDVVDAANTESVWIGGDPEFYDGDMATWLESVPDGKLFFGWTEGHSEQLPNCGSAKLHMLTVNTLNPKYLGDSEEMRKKQRNPNSLVLGIEFGSTKIVLAGDAEGDTQDSAIANAGEFLGHLTLLAASHHGAATEGSNQGAWPSHTAPRIVVYSSGTSNGHPNTNIIDDYQPYLMDAAEHPFHSALSRTKPYVRYDTAKAEYTTELNGLIIFESDGDGLGLSCQYQDESCFWPD